MSRDGRPGKGGWGLPQSALGPAQLCHQEMTGRAGEGKGDGAETQSQQTEEQAREKNRGNSRDLPCPQAPACRRSLLCPQLQGTEQLDPFHEW